MVVRLAAGGEHGRGRGKVPVAPEAFDPYVVLGVGRNATKEEIVAAYQAAKSKYDPGPPPQSQTLKVDAVGKGEKVTSETVTADGKKVTVTYTANFDGKDYPLTGSALGADKVSLKRIDARTTERIDKKDGKPVVTIRRVVSADGKTMTATSKGTNAEGKPTNNVAVFEK